MMSSTQSNIGSERLAFGIYENLDQFVRQLVQVFFVGLTIGMLRTVVPALAESEFNIAEGSFVALATFVIAFGVVKAVMNFAAGRLADQIGRKRVLVFGWVAAIPIPFLVFFAPSLHWIVVATVFLGINQGLCWSMTQTAKLDFTRADERGLTMGLNEFSGYVGVAIAGIVTGYLATVLDPRLGLLIFGVTVIATAFVIAVTLVRETLPWAQAAESATQAPVSSDRQPDNALSNPKPRGPTSKSAVPAAAMSTVQIFALMSWRDRRMAALSQAGLVEKFVDALIWVIYPVYLYQAGLGLGMIGWVVGVYGFVWGGAQLMTGRLSDHIGRQFPIASGMWICGAGVAISPLFSGVAGWTFAAAITGLGMALLYPNLSAAVADHAQPAWRGSAIGVYRFWRDLGYAIGALAFGVTAQATGAIVSAFWLVATAMFLSGALVAWWGGPWWEKPGGIGARERNR
ncbi:MAG: MFS transporter [Thioalkalivibrionaceae bacterium]